MSEYAPTAAEVKKLRDATGAGVLDCRQALADAGGDMDKGLLILRERGLAGAAKRAGREATDGLIHSYLHAPTPGLPPKIGVLLELNTETDFTAKTDDVRQLAQQLALHVAAAKPLYLKAEDVPEPVLENERELMRRKLEGKPPQALEKALENVVKSYAKDFCLLEQEWVHDPKRRVKDVIGELASKTGENIGVRRFVRYEVAEALD